jgi:endonuclease/exonuclease/phosphatase family metal-dependent hydrolase
MLSKNIQRPALFFTLFIFIYAATAETITIATYNILNYPDACGLERIDDFRIVIDYIEPDIMVVQEMQSQAGMDVFLDSVLNFTGSAFEAVSFNDGPDTDNGLFFRSDKIDFLSARYITTINRDIAEYRLRVKNSQQDMYIFSIHFKSSQGSTNEEIRLEEATVLRNHLNSFSANTNFLVMGDFNIYYSNEPAFHMLTDSLANNNGRLFDPLKSIGDWHENSNYASVHSQSSRVEQLQDGGSGGGLDDRFDMILCSQSLFDSTGLFLLGDSYTTCGNDGNHFNSSVNDGYNQSVPDSVAHALYYASDHLPIFVDITDDYQYDEPEVVIQIWPNPMETETEIHFPWFDDFQKAEITLTNILGQRVYTIQTNDPLSCTIRRENLPVGIYFVHLKIETKYTVHHFHTKLAIIK